VTRPLGERKVLVVILIVYATRGEVPDRFRQQVGKIGAFHLLGDLMFGLLSRMDHQRVTLYQRPLDGLLRTVDLETLPVLAGGVKQRAVNMRTQIRIFEFDVSGLHCEWGTILVVQFFPDAPRTETRYVLGLIAGKAQNRPYTMRSVVHRRQAGPIIRPSIHILLVAGFEELDFT